MSQELPSIVSEHLGENAESMSSHPMSEEQKLPCLNHDVVLKILRLAEVQKYGKPELIVLRSLGKAWRLAIDNLYLPYCCKPSSLWSPYMSDKAPEDDLTRSPGKHFKFPQDIELFQEMCSYPHNPFPTRELKIWCQGELPLSADFGPSLDLIANHIWSLTYAVGPSINSIRLLFDLLSKMPYLEDLRVIETHPESIQEELAKQVEVVQIALPQLRLPSSPPTKLTCLSVVGSCDSFILDELLNAYKGSGI